MRIVFGLALDHLHLPLPQTTKGNILYVGPRTLLLQLERFMGLATPQENNEHLRTEQYRQMLDTWLNQAGHTSFLSSSFAVNPVATSSFLLELRDELLLAGFNFRKTKVMPERIELICTLESQIQDHPLAFPSGFADRWDAVVRHLGQRHHPITFIQTTDTESIIPIYIKRFFTLLKQHGVSVAYASQPPEGKASSDLNTFRKSLCQPLHKVRAAGDGSLILIRGKRDSDLAAVWAALMKKNPTLRPYHLVPDKSKILDFALQAEGLPCLGVSAISQARPSLQILKLISIFLWQPLDPFGLMSFLSLTIKPLEEKLARDMAQLLAETPGLGSAQWHTMIGLFIKRLEEDEVPEKKTLIRQYQFWFERPRYNPIEGAPVTEAIKRYEHLFQWAKQIAAEHTDPNNLNLLIDQTRQVIELLENRHLPTITKLELEQMVKAVHEPASIQLAPTQVGMQPPVYYPHAITQNIDQLVWWNFIQYEPDHFFSKWYQSERKWLAQLSPGISLETPAEANQRWVQFRKTAIWRTQKQLILIIPEIAEGQETTAHPLMGDLEATFQDIQPFTIRIDNPTDIHKLSAWLVPPQWNTYTPTPLLPVEPFIQIPTKQSILERDRESASSLQDLFYYPYKWVFRYTAKWRSSPILSIVQEKTLLGKLAHRFVELVFAEKPIEKWTQKELYHWINKMAHPLLQQEGSVLLLYGKEPQKLHFLNQVKLSLWNLIDLLKNNQWTNAQTEVELTGQLGSTPLFGRADLILERGHEKLIIDLKWSGASHRRDQIKSKEDLQLVLYSHMMAQEPTKVYAAFYILSTGKMIARSNEPFPEIDAILPETDYHEVHNEILNKMKKTAVWRMAQLKSGKIELRTQATARDLADAYLDEPLLELLEMKTEDAFFDDYKTLMSSVEHT